MNSLKPKSLASKPSSQISPLASNANPPSSHLQSTCAPTPPHQSTTSLLPQRSVGLQSQKSSPRISPSPSPRIPSLAFPPLIHRTYPSSALPTCPLTNRIPTRLPSPRTNTSSLPPATISLPSPPPTRTTSSLPFPRPTRTTTHYKLYTITITRASRITTARTRGASSPTTTSRARGTSNPTRRSIRSLGRYRFSYRRTRWTEI